MCKVAWLQAIVNIYVLPDSNTGFMRGGLRRWGLEVTSLLSALYPSRETSNKLARKRGSRWFPSQKIDGEGIEKARRKGGYVNRNKYIKEEDKQRQKQEIVK
jgi:hypothetical protein